MLNPSSTVERVRLLFSAIFLFFGFLAAACASEPEEPSGTTSSQAQFDQDEVPSSELVEQDGLGVDEGSVADDDQVVFLVDELPDDFPSGPLFVCTSDPSLGSVVGYRGLETRESDVYSETAFLRLFAQPQAPENTFLRGLSGFNDDETPVDIGGLAGVAFTVSTAEPVLHPWPALAWEQDGAFIQLLGEGMDEQELLAAAISVRQANEADLDEGGLLDSVACQ